jgi:hypothetical protein
MDEREEPSTGVANEQKPVVIGSGMIADEWHMLDEEGYTGLLFRIFSQLVRNSTPGDTIPSSGTLPVSQDLAQDKNSSTPLKGFASLFRKAMNTDWTRVKCALEDIILLSSADTGGHTEFLDMHAVLINGPSFNLLFRRLTDALNEVFPVHFTDENGKSTTQEDSDCTVKEVLFQVLSNITCFGNFRTGEVKSSESNATASLQKALESQQSKVMIVGSFKDEVSDEIFEEEDAELQREIQGTEFYKDVMYADHEKGQLMLKVDNKNGGVSEIEKIRTIIKTKIEKCFPPIPVPASWFVLSLLLHDHQDPTMTLGDCEVLAEKLNIGLEELQTALWFLHHSLGAILYYPGGDLKNTIFCQIQAVYESITDLTKKTYTSRYVQHESSLEEFSNLGLFSLQEIKNAPEDPTSVSRDLLVRLLKHLNIVTPAPSMLSPTGIKDPYLMPCKLRYSRDPINIPEGNPKPLLLHFKCGFTPVGMFPALITKLFSQADDLKWKIIKGGPKRDKLFKNRVCFRVERDIIYLMSHLRYFEIAVSQKKVSRSCSSAEGLCHRVREVFEDALQKVTENMNYHFLGGHQYAFWCTQCHGVEKHLTVLKDVTSTFMECLRSPEETEDLSDQQLVWFSKARAIPRGNSQSCIIILQYIHECACPY